MGFTSICKIINDIVKWTNRKLAYTLKVKYAFSPISFGYYVRFSGYTYTAVCDVTLLAKTDLKFNLLVVVYITHIQPASLPEAGFFRHL